MNNDKSKHKIKKRYNRIAPLYDKFEYLMEKGSFSSWRQNLWQKVYDFSPDNNAKILEAGVGTGENVQYYPENAEIYAVDFSEKMLKQAENKADKYQKDVNFLEMDIQNLKFDEDFFDIIVSTCVFCSVPDPVAGFEELKRVCKPEGRIVLLEHMRTEKEPWGKVMDKLNWISLYAWGANINRRTMENIKKAGLKVEEVKDVWLDIVKEIVLTV